MENTERSYVEQKERITTAEVQVGNKTFIRVDKITQVDDVVKMDVRKGFYRDGKFTYTKEGMRFVADVGVGVAEGLIKAMNKEQLEELKKRIGSLLD